MDRAERKVRAERRNRYRSVFTTSSGRQVLADLITVNCRLFGRLDPIEDKITEDEINIRQKVGMEILATMDVIPQPEGNCSPNDFVDNILRNVEDDRRIRSVKRP
jgi:hypothetical protein